MTEAPDVVAAFLHVAQETDPFVSTYTGDGASLYTSVKFRRGYPLGEEATPTVSLELVPGGGGRRQGIGTVRQFRTPSITVHVLTENELESQRIIEKLRQAWQADFDVDLGTFLGGVGDGYLRATGKVHDFQLTESQKVPFDDAGRINRRIFDINVDFADS